MSDTTTVALVDPPACLPKTTRPYILTFGKSQFHVPASTLFSTAKRVNKIDTPEELGQLLSTKAPDKWEKYLSPDHLIRITCPNGTNCVYTTFEVAGHPEESRFLRFISSTIAEKCFPRIIESLDGVYSRETPREQRRWEVLQWKKDVDCPTKAQLNPEVNLWASIPVSEHVKSCAIAPVSRRRPKGASDKRSAPDEELTSLRKTFVKREVMFEVGPKGTYSIAEVDGLVHVTQYACGPMPDDILGDMNAIDDDQ